jgi:hypothetical protein
MVQDLNAGRKDSKRKETSHIVVEQYRQKRVMKDCCAWAGKAAGSIRVCLELFVTFCFKAKSKEEMKRLTSLITTKAPLQGMDGAYFISFALLPRRLSR